MRPGKSLRPAGTALAAAAALALTAGPALGGSARPALAPGPMATSEQSSDLYAPGEAIVRFEPGASAASRRDAREAAEVEFEQTLGVPRAQLVDVDGSVQAAIRRLGRQPGVAYAQPNFRYEAASKDTFFGELWGLDDPAPLGVEDPGPGVYAEAAWEQLADLGKGRGAGQVIAVLDTGVDLTHPDLVDNLWENPSPDPVDKDVRGFDFVDEDGDPDDYEFHGTHVAGTAAAKADNELGVAGVAPEAEIMAVRVLDGDGEGNTADIAAGIDYAADHGADVINMSLGGPAGSKDQLTEDAIEAATDSVVVVAAGNEAADNEVEPHSPCVLPQANLICVAALNKLGTLASFSNYGAKSVDIAAPGGGDVVEGGILSAKTDYGVPLFADGFESGFGSVWDTAAFDGGIEWVESTSPAIGTKSASDSPGDYGQGPAGSEDLAVSELFTVAPTDLTGERGCRSHFETMYEIEPEGPKGELFDTFVAGAAGEGLAAPSAFRLFAGTSALYSKSKFQREEVSISDLDGRSDVHPIFGVLADEFLEFDGAYVDDVRLICRDETYEDEIATVAEVDLANAGNYVRFSGTSMATPHVAGVVALVRAAAPALDPEQAVAAVLDGASAIPTFAPGKRTVTEGIADACKAVAIATGGDVATDCPASAEPVAQPPTQGGTVPPPIQIPVTETPNPFESNGAPRAAGNPAPRTFLLRHPPKVLRTEGQRAKAVFRFGSNEAGVTFLCRLDRAPFRRCRRTTVRRVALGPHIFRVKARDSDGKADRTPAVFRFRVEQTG